jgi:hypothetical protein
MKLKRHNTKSSIKHLIKTIKPQAKCDNLWNQNLNDKPEFNAIYLSCKSSYTTSALTAFMLNNASSDAVNLNVTVFYFNYVQAQGQRI